MNSFAITKVTGREIIDSRGNPTVEAEVMLENGVIGRGAAPAAAGRPAGDRGRQRWNPSADPPREGI